MYSLFLPRNFVIMPTAGNGNCFLTDLQPVLNVRVFELMSYKLNLLRRNEKIDGNLLLGIKYPF